MYLAGPARFVLPGAKTMSYNNIMNAHGTALVTGAAKRVGRAIAIQLAQAGYDIAVHYNRSAAEAQATADAVQNCGRRALLIAGDLSNTARIESIVTETSAQLGPLTVLVNNASIFEKTPLEQTSAETWTRLLTINTIAPALLARAAALQMRQTGGGKIINLIDIQAEHPTPRYGPYCATKAALACLTKALALELAPQITVNGVAPGIAPFPDHYEQTLRDHMTARVPLQRAGTSEEVARLVRFLIEQGDYITGQIIAIDGGWSIT